MEKSLYVRFDYRNNGRKMSVYIYAQGTEVQSTGKTHIKQ